jgi:hypothetical protein
MIQHHISNAADLQRIQILDLLLSARIETGKVPSQVHMIAGPKCGHEHNDLQVGMLHQHGDGQHCEGACKGAAGGCCVL